MIILVSKYRNGLDMVSTSLNIFFKDLEGIIYKIENLKIYRTLFKVKRFI